MKIQRICQYCGKEFTAQKTVTRYCSHRCNSKDYKKKVRTDKIEASNEETKRIILQPVEQLKAKEFLTVRNVATLLNCSIRTAYRLISQGNIKAVNISQRKTLVRRSDIDKLFEQPQPVKPQQEKKTEPVKYEISDCYKLQEIRKQYGISDKALHDLIKRKGIPKIKKGWFTYVPKMIIDKLLSL